MLGFGYCLMVSYLFCFLCFTSPVSLTGFYTEDEPFYVRLNTGIAPTSGLGENNGLVLLAGSNLRYQYKEMTGAIPVFNRVCRFLSRHLGKDPRWFRTSL